MAKRAGLVLALSLVTCSALAQLREPASAHTARPHAAVAALDKSQLSYAIGFQIGSQFADGSPAVDVPTLERGIEDAYHKRHPSVSIAQMRAQLRALEMQMRNQALSDFEKLAETNARKSAQFMAQNSRQPGVVQLPSGIQYQVLTRGSGRVSPSATSRVTVNYRGMLADGTEFDSTWAHGAPATFNVSGVIPGWRDVIPRMHVGDRWKVVIPPSLAYGERGALPRIGPNEALVFDIQLLDIVQQ